MKPQVYQSPFSSSAFPIWNCPYCLDGTLKVKEGSLVITETEDSKSRHSHEDFEPDWIKSNFAMELKCTHCNELAFGVGKTQFVEVMDEEYGWGLEEAIVPLFFHPTIPLFILSPTCPKDVRAQIVKAFSLYWCDVSACANRIRVAVELILTHEKIKIGTRIKNGKNKNKIRRLSLHERIQLYESKNSSIANAMMAIKWIGNTGSHADELVQSDVLNAFQLLEHAIAEVFDKRSSEIAKLSKRINKKKGA
jgi:hypothetical protein